MGEFLDAIRAHNARVELELVPAVFVGTVAEVKNSIQFGSPLTGAPGQVVADEHGGNLRASWQSEFTDPNNAIVSTNVPYAESNEDGIARPGGGPYVQRSAVGGRWSVALTRMGIQRIVDDVAAKLTEGGDPRPSGFQDNSVLGGSGS
jgi:phage gpG-like protein